MIILFFILCLVNHNINGYLHNWLKLNEKQVLQKNADVFFKLFVHINENSFKEISNSSKQNKLSVFIDNEDNVIQILDNHKLIIDSSNQVENGNLSNSAEMNSKFEDNSDNTQFNDTSDKSKNANGIYLKNKENYDDAIQCNISYGICEEVPSYPNDLLEEELNHLTAFEKFNLKDWEPDFGSGELEVDDRFGGSEIEPLCQSEKQIIRPKTAWTEYDKLSLVVNNGKFVQIMEIEICSNPKQPCDFSENFPEGYTTVCVQKYVHRKLLAIDSSKKLAPKIFKIPAGCCCGVKF